MSAIHDHERVRCGTGRNDTLRLRPTVATQKSGAGNGILSITRGTLPLVLFDLQTYGSFVGKLLVPSFVLSAVSPLAFAAAIDRFDAKGGLYLSMVLSTVTLAAGLALRTLARRGSDDLYP